MKEEEKPEQEIKTTDKVVEKEDTRSEFEKHIDANKQTNPPWDEDDTDVLIEI